MVEEETRRGDDPSQSAPTGIYTKTQRKDRLIQLLLGAIVGSSSSSSLPEVGPIEEEDAHHGSIKQEHKADIEIRRVTQTWCRAEEEEEEEDGQSDQ